MGGHAGNVLRDTLAMLEGLLESCGGSLAGRAGEKRERARRFNSNNPTPSESKCINMSCRYQLNRRKK